MVNNVTVARLEETLPHLALTLASLRDLLAAEREAVAAGDLQGVLALTMEREELNARMSRLDGQRQILQATLEAELGVQGLQAIANAVIQKDPGHQQLLSLIADFRVTVAELLHEHERCAALLSAAAAAAHQMRSYLSPSGGTQQPTGPAVRMTADHRAQRLPRI